MSTQKSKFQRVIFTGSYTGEDVSEKNKERYAVRLTEYGTPRGYVSESVTIPCATRTKMDNLCHKLRESSTWVWEEDFYEHR